MSLPSRSTIQAGTLKQATLEPDKTLHRDCTKNSIDFVCPKMGQFTMLNSLQCNEEVGLVVTVTL